MNDNAIIELYNSRSESALTESNAKYGSYCRTVAMNILDNTEDSEECVNDTWLRAWNSIPPKCPRILRMFFAKITRNLALDRLKFMRRDKRCPAEAALILDELSECIPAGTGVETELDVNTSELSSYGGCVDFKVSADMYDRLYELAIGLDETR